MDKPVIQIKIEGPQGSGKTMLAQTLASLLRIQGRYLVVSSTDDSSDRELFQLEDEYHFLQITTEQTPKEKEVSNG